MKEANRFPGVIALTLLLAAAAAAASAGGHPGSGTGPTEGGRLGVLVRELSMWELQRHGLDYGVQVVRVMPGSPAETGGLREQDIVLEIAGRPVYSVERLRWLLGRPGEMGQTSLALQRDGGVIEVAVDLEPSPSALSRRPPGSLAPGRTSGRAFLGISTQPMTADLREAFGVSEDVGVLISKVSVDSPAANAGLKAGDVIVKMDRKGVARLADIHRVLDYFEPGDEIDVEIVRAKQSETLRVRLAEPPGAESMARQAPWWERPETLFPPPDDLRRDLERLMREWEERWKEYWERRPGGSMQGTRAGAGSRLFVPRPA